jgi:hypothetical protein
VKRSLWTCDSCGTEETAPAGTLEWRTLPLEWRTLRVEIYSPHSDDERRDLCPRCWHRLDVFLTIGADVGELIDRVGTVEAYVLPGPTPT